MTSFIINFIGAVKLTPAHDHNDYDAGKRTGLKFITMMDEDGLVRDVGDFKSQYKKFIVSFQLFTVAL